MDEKPKRMKPVDIPRSQKVCRPTGEQWFDIYERLREKWIGPGGERWWKRDIVTFLGRAGIEKDEARRLSWDIMGLRWPRSGGGPIVFDKHEIVRLCVRDGKVKREHVQELKKCV